MGEGRLVSRWPSDCAGKRAMKYTQRTDGEGWTERSGKRTRWACCDCGLVHDIVFIAKGRVIGVAAKRNNRATAARRRGKKKRVGS